MGCPILTVVPFANPVPSRLPQNCRGRRRWRVSWDYRSLSTDKLS